MALVSFISMHNLVHFFPPQIQLPVPDHDSLLDAGKKSMGTLKMGLAEGRAMVNLLLEAESNNFTFLLFPSLVQKPQIQLLLPYSVITTKMQGQVERQLYVHIHTSPLPPPRKKTCQGCREEIWSFQTLFFFSHHNLAFGLSGCALSQSPILYKLGAVRASNR